MVRVTAVRTTAETPGTELGRLRDRAAALTRAIKDGKRDHAAQIGELEDHVKTAGQIQVLALANQELREQTVGYAARPKAPPHGHQPAAAASGARR